MNDENFFKKSPEKNDQPEWAATSRVCDSYSFLSAMGEDKQAMETWIYPVNYPLRDYQFNIVKEALLKNTLVCLPTGMGKTFIAAVVMYNYYRWFPTSRIVFMAPTKPLVTQQIEACFNIMGVPQEHMSEITGTKLPEKRITIWRESRIIFLTPQVLVNDLSRGACASKLIKLIVIDEAHKALGEYAYCQVIKQLKQQQYEFRVLALSATPGSDIQAVQQVLCNLLISHIEIRTDDSIDLADYSHQRSIEKVIVKMGKELDDIRNKFYQIIKPYVKRLKEKNVLFTNDEKSLSKFKILKSRESFRKDPPANLNHHIKGVLEGTFALCLTLYHALELLQMHGIRSFYSFMKSSLENKGHTTSKGELMNNNDFKEMYSELDRLYGGNKDDNTLENSSLVVGASHPKLVKLIEIVKDHFQRYSQLNCSTRIMIFSQYRDSVMEITEMLKKCDPLVRPMNFIGQSNAVRGKKGFSQQEQIAVMKKFKEGGFNTLISTCVGEEGLDIGEVDLIICYDVLKSPIRLIQRMGRTGRKREGKVVMLITEGAEEKNYAHGQYKQKSLTNALLDGKRLKGTLYTNNPRMIPQGLDPICIKMKMKVREWQSSLKRKKLNKSKSPNKGGTKKKIKPIEEEGIKTPGKGKKKKIDRTDRMKNCIDSYFTKLPSQTNPNILNSNCSPIPPLTEMNSEIEILNEFGDIASKRKTPFLYSNEPISKRFKKDLSPVDLMFNNVRPKKDKFLFIKQPPSIFASTTVDYICPRDVVNICNKFNSDLRKRFLLKCSSFFEKKEMSLTSNLPTQGTISLKFDDKVNFDLFDESKDFSIMNHPPSKLFNPISHYEDNADKPISSGNKPSSLSSEKYDLPLPRDLVGIAALASPISESVEPNKASDIDITSPIISQTIKKKFKPTQRTSTPLPNHAKRLFSPFSDFGLKSGMKLPSPFVLPNQKERVDKTPKHFSKAHFDSSCDDLFAESLDHSRSVSRNNEISLNKDPNYEGLSNKLIEGNKSELKRSKSLLTETQALHLLDESSNIQNAEIMFVNDESFTSKLVSFKRDQSFSSKPRLSRNRVNRKLSESFKNSKPPEVYIIQENHTDKKVIDASSGNPSISRVDTGWIDCSKLNRNSQKASFLDKKKDKVKDPGILSFDLGFSDLSPLPDINANEELSHINILKFEECRKSFHEPLLPVNTEGIMNSSSFDDGFKQAKDSEWQKNNCSSSKSFIENNNEVSILSPQNNKFNSPKEMDKNILNHSDFLRLHECAMSPKKSDKTLNETISPLNFKRKKTGIIVRSDTDVSEVEEHSRNESDGMKNIIKDNSFSSDDDFKNPPRKEFKTTDACQNRRFLKKKQRASEFIEREANVSVNDLAVSSDESESSLDTYDGSFVDDECQPTQANVDTKAMYLQSVRSPLKRAVVVGKNTERAKFEDTILDTYSSEEDSEDSFVVSNDHIEYDTEYCGDTMLAEDPLINKALLEEIEMEKKRPTKKRKRLIISSDSSSCDDKVPLKIHKIITERSSSSKDINFNIGFDLGDIKCGTNPTEKCELGEIICLVDNNSSKENLSSSIDLPQVVDPHKQSTAQNLKSLQLSPKFNKCNIPDAVCNSGGFALNETSPGRDSLKKMQFLNNNKFKGGSNPSVNPSVSNSSVVPTLIDNCAGPNSLAEISSCHQPLKRTLISENSKSENKFSAFSRASVHPSTNTSKINNISAKQPSGSSNSASVNKSSVIPHVNGNTMCDNMSDDDLFYDALEILEKDDDFKSETKPAKVDFSKVTKPIAPNLKLFNQKSVSEFSIKKTVFDFVSKNINDTKDSRTESNTGHDASSSDVNASSSRSSLICSQSSCVGSKNQEPLFIIVDSSELSISGLIISNLKDSKGCKTMVTSINPASYIISSRMAVYRQTYSNFTNSQNRKALVFRIQSLLKLYERPVIIIEFDSSLTVKDIHRNQYFDSLTCAFSQLPQLKLIQTSCKDETAHFIWKLANVERLKGNALPFIEAGNKMLKFFRTFPPISFSSAIFLSKNFLTLRHFLNSSGDELMKKGRLTKSQAANVLSLIKRNFRKDMIPSINISDPT